MILTQSSLDLQYLYLYTCDYRNQSPTLPLLEVGLTLSSQLTSYSNRRVWILSRDSLQQTSQNRSYTQDSILDIDSTAYASLLEYRKLVLLGPSSENENSLVRNSSVLD